MLVVMHQECGRPAMEDSTIGEGRAILTDRFPFACFSCHEDIVDESELTPSEELVI
jgi:hypothetical protein